MPMVFPFQMKLKKQPGAKYCSVVYMTRSHDSSRRASSHPPLVKPRPSAVVERSAILELLPKASGSCEIPSSPWSDSGKDFRSLKEERHEDPTGAYSRYLVPETLLLEPRTRIPYWRSVGTVPTRPRTLLVLATVVAIVFLELDRKVRRLMVSTNRISIRQLFTVILLIAALSAVLLSDIWQLGLFGILGGVIAGGLKFWRDNGRIEPAKFDSSGPARIHMDTAMTDAVTYHRGISINHIPVEGAIGFLFVIATVFIFGGILAIREILVLTAPLGILAAGLLFYWHKRHPLKIEALHLKRNH